MIISGSSAPNDTSINVTLTVNPIPVAVAGSNSPVCAGSSINLTAQTVAGGTYQWTGPNAYSSGVQNPVITNASTVNAGIYSLIVLANGCTSVPSTITVIVNNCAADLSVVKTVNNAHPIVGQNVIFTIIATNSGPSYATGVIVTDILQSGYNYVSSSATKGIFNTSTGIWTIDTLNSGTSATLNLTVKINSTGNYVNTATIKGNQGDGDTANNVSTIETFPIEFFIPQGFSPNGDGTNDVFFIRGLEIYPNNTFLVYNRWGNKLFEASPYQNNWDGRSTSGLRVGGDALPVGTYFYVFDPGDGSAVIKGTIYLNR